MDSTVIHYKKQRFHTNGLRMALLKELNARSMDIAQSKAFAVRLEKEAAVEQEKVVELQARLKNRKAAYAASVPLPFQEHRLESDAVAAVLVVRPGRRVGAA